MKTLALSLLFWVVSVAARGVSIHIGAGFSDDWDAPGQLKAAMAFQIIWGLVGISELSLLVKYLRFIPVLQARAPYIMLTILMVMFPVAYLVDAVYTRIRLDAEFTLVAGLDTFVSVFFDFLIPFQMHAVLLYIAHQRGFLFQASQGKGIKPLAAQLWKRILDWALVAITFVLLISSTAIAAVENHVIEENHQSLSEAEYLKYTHLLEGFSHAITGMIVILAIDVFVTLLTLWLAQRRFQFRDPVVTHLLAFAFPFVAGYAIKNLVMEIYLNVAKNIIENNVEVAEVIINGICQLGITAAVISTMIAPGVQWISTTPPAPGFVQPVQYLNYQYGWQPPAHNLAYQQQPPSQPYSIPMNVQYS